MILFDTNSPALRYAASLISGVENADEPVKVVVGDGEVYFTLKCGLKIKAPIWKGEYDTSDFADRSEFYFNARFLGKALNTCINSEQIAFMRQEDTVHIAGYLKKPEVPQLDSKKEEGDEGVPATYEEPEPMFSYEAEMANVEPFDEAVFGESSATFKMEQSDMVELFSLSDYFNDVDICRKSGVVSFRVGNDGMSVVTRYNMSNLGNSKSDPNFAFNVSKSTMKLLSFIGNGSVTIDYDEKNSTIATVLSQWLPKWSLASTIPLFSRTEKLSSSPQVRHLMKLFRSFARALLQRTRMTSFPLSTLGRAMSALLGRKSMAKSSK